MPQHVDQLEQSMDYVAELLDQNESWEGRHKLRHIWCCLYRDFCAALPLHLNS